MDCTDFDLLCKDFQTRKPCNPTVGLIPWFSVKIGNGDESVNDILRRFLREQGYVYINDFDGNVWFTGNELDIWTRAESEVRDCKVKFYFCKFEN